MLIPIDVFSYLNSIHAIMLMLVMHTFSCTYTHPYTYTHALTYLLASLPVRAFMLTFLHFCIHACLSIHKYSYTYLSIITHLNICSQVLSYIEIRFPIYHAYNFDPIPWGLIILPIKPKYIYLICI